jgi:hypothetical protein
MREFHNVFREFTSREDDENERGSQIFVPYQEYERGRRNNGQDERSGKEMIMDR